MAAVAIAAVVGIGALLGVEALMARRGADVDTPDVATLTTVHVPEGVPRTDWRVVWLGDSTAAAVGTTAPQHSVSSRVGEALSRACAVTVRTQVIAKSGARVDDVLRDQVPVAATLDADVVLISVGANDTIHLTSPSRFTSTYRAVVDRVVAAGVAADRVIMIGVPDMGSPPRLPQPLRALVGARGRVLDRRVKAVAGEAGAAYVDLFAGTSERFRDEPGRYFAADNYHPSDDGYAVWGRVITPVAAAPCRRH